MRTRFEGPSSDRLYVRLDALAGGTGGGGATNGGPNSAQLDSFHGDLVPVAFNTNTSTDAVNRTYAVPTFEALESSRGFSSASVGYAGTASDGQQMLDSAHALTRYDSAPNGHVALTAAVRLDRDHSADLALGFATTDKQALRVAGDAADQSFSTGVVALRAPVAALRLAPAAAVIEAGLRRGAPVLPLGQRRQGERGQDVPRRDRGRPGVPVGAGGARPDTIANGKPQYFGSYREVFARDLYEAFTGLLVAGDVRTARAATRFLFEDQQQADGSMPRNSLENGKVAPDTGGVQLDETSYPILMDWQSGLAGDRALYRKHVIPAADFLVAHGPTDGVERWEEQNGYSPSTIAAEIAGLTAAAHIATVNGDAAPRRGLPGNRRRLRAQHQGLDGDDHRAVQRPARTSSGCRKNGNPNAAITYNLGNGVQSTLDQRAVIDAGFLELVRLGVLPADDPDIENSVSVVDKVIERPTSNGPGFYRYGTNATESADGYGDCFQPSLEHLPDPAASRGRRPTPAPATCGRCCPASAASTTSPTPTRTDAQRAARRAIAKMTSGDYLEPEQVWENPDLRGVAVRLRSHDRLDRLRERQPVGSASPLTWAQATYARLAIDLGAGRNVETPGIVTDRYVTNGMPGSLPVTITSPTGGATIDTATVDVTARPRPVRRSSREASGFLRRGRGDRVDHRGRSGNWSLTSAGRASARARSR